MRPQAKEQTTKKAFLENVDSSCIGFNDGTQLNVFDEWSKRNEDSSKLTWQPELAIIASSGELGVTTGNWEYRAKSLQDTPVAHGNFTTVWKKKNNGEWKAILDAGIAFPQKIANSSTVKKIVLKNINSPTFDSAEPMQADKKFVEAFQKDAAAAVNNAIENDSWISIRSVAPLKNEDAIRASINLIPSHIQFMPAGSFVSKNGDLLVVYGTQKAITKSKHLCVYGKERIATGNCC